MVSDQKGGHIQYEYVDDIFPILRMIRGQCISSTSTVDSAQERSGPEQVTEGSKIEPSSDIQDQSSV